MEKNFFSLPAAEGPFQSDALLVPEGCLFDHIHNASRCWPFVRWNQTGATACQERNMQMRSFAMLLPCGISLFSGVEFVCCPKHFKGECDIRFFYCYCRLLRPVTVGSSEATASAEASPGKNERGKSLSLNLFPFSSHPPEPSTNATRKSTLTTFFIYSCDIFQFIFEFRLPSSAIKVLFNSPSLVLRRSESLIEKSISLRQ